MCDDRLESLAVRLYDAGAVKIGDIEAKVGRRTPIYFDLRIVVSYPDIMMVLAELLSELTVDIDYDLICGVPYAALPIATIISYNTKIPLIIKRKEDTHCGSTKKNIDGVFTPNQKCLLVEDVVTSGGSLLESVNTLRSQGLRVLHAVVVLDRQQGGATMLKHGRLEMRSLFTLTNLMKTLRNARRIDNETMDTVLEHIKQCQFGIRDNY